jgi:hypothetical protein
MIFMVVSPRSQLHCSSDGIIPGAAGTPGGLSVANTLLGDA